MNNYIIPKYILKDIYIIENPKIYKIRHSYKNLQFIATFGIIFKINITNIVKKMNNYLIYISNIDELIKYDNFLESKIKDYKKIVKENNYFIVTKNIQNRNNIYLNIKYVKKTGFLNIPILELYNG
tara:strand:+ start:1752 stop:2129 length:378 start_codon:yes stop_codon:yes gene_type:complete